jgi:hypothetical protein
MGKTGFVHIEDNSAAKRDGKPKIAYQRSEREEAEESKQRRKETEPAYRLFVFFRPPFCDF